MEFELANIPIIPTLLGLALAGHGYRKKSLSPSGALTAFVVGSIMMTVPLRTFGVSLISFYLIGSRATKVGKAQKALLEEGHQEAGYRNGMQVICNAFSAFVASVLWSALFVHKSLASLILEKLSFDVVALEKPYVSQEWCALSRDVGGGWSRRLLFVTLGHFACCLGDTLASELGILSKRPPFLITSFKTVPPGTNGGISTLGLSASLGGGVIMGLIMSASILAENTACRDAWSAIILDLFMWGIAGGLGGSLIDSMLGATIQQTRFSSKSKLILTDESVVPEDQTADVKVVSGINILTNNQVNLVSSILTSVIIAYLA